MKCAHWLHHKDVLIYQKCPLQGPVSGAWMDRNEIAWMKEWPGSDILRSTKAYCSSEKLDNENKKENNRVTIREKNNLFLCFN